MSLYRGHHAKPCPHTGYPQTSASTRLTAACRLLGRGNVAGGWLAAIRWRRNVSDLIRDEMSRELHSPNIVRTYPFCMDTPVDFLSHDSVAPNAVADLLDLCFGPARAKRTAALLREGALRIEAASFIARSGEELPAGEELLGSVECWELEWRHPQGARRIALLGPLVSHPAHRGERIGARLMDLALAELDKLRLPVMLIGDMPYYDRWGFSAQHTGDWVLPGPVDRHRLLLRARAGHRLRGPALIGAPDRASEAA